MLENYFIRLLMLMLLRLGIDRGIKRLIKHNKLKDTKNFHRAEIQTKNLLGVPSFKSTRSLNQIHRLKLLVEGLPKSNVLVLTPFRTT